MSKNTRIVVTGAGGFIGYHLVKRLVVEGYWVRGVDVRYPNTVRARPMSSRFWICATSRTVSRPCGEESPRKIVRILVLGINNAPERTSVAPFTTGPCEHLAAQGNS